MLPLLLRLLLLLVWLAFGVVVVDVLLEGVKYLQYSSTVDLLPTAAAWVLKPAAAPVITDIRGTWSTVGVTHVTPQSTLGVLILLIALLLLLVQLLVVWLILLWCSHVGWQAPPLRLLLQCLWHLMLLLAQAMQ
jgi:hypothetical protein